MNQLGAAAVSRRAFLGTGAAAGALLAVAGPPYGVIVPASAASAPADLEALTDGFPRGVFFRRPVTPISDEFDFAEYLRWEATYLALDGIVGKVLGEEQVGGRKEVIQRYYRTFKRRNPGKLALLHFNGKGRRPRFNGDRFSSRHWVYLAGTTVTEGTTEPGQQATIRVANVNRFQEVREGDRYPDDIVIVPPSEAGEGYDWERAQHARLDAKGPEPDAITIRLGVWDFSPAAAIQPGSHIAPHARIRPPVLDGHEDESLWLYNFSPQATDRRGRTCADVLVDEFGEFFAPDGALTGVDGVQFDVMFFVPNGEIANPAVVYCYDESDVDIDNDRMPDGGFAGGQNVYGLGVLEFGRKLRAALPDKLLLADGMLPEVNQRNFGSFNGMESEGFPIHRDPDFAEWCGGLNRQYFWRSRGGSPAFNYVLFKPGDGGGVAYSRFRLAAAAAVFTGAAVGVGGTVPPPNDDGVRVFDELWNGIAETPNWLGRPLGPATVLATRRPDLFENRGVTWPQGFVDRIGGPGATVRREPGSPARARISWGAGDGSGEPTDTGAPLREVTVPIPAPFPAGQGPDPFDLVIELTLSGDGVPGYPPQIARRVRVQALVDGEPVPTVPDGSGGNPAEFYYTWADAEPFTAIFLFRDAPPGRATLVITAEGGADLVLHRLTAHAGRGTMLREFDNGLVVANPSLHADEVDLPPLQPGWCFRHIDGQPGQDREVNNGAPAGRSLVVPNRDARFLVKAPC